MPESYGNHLKKLERAQKFGEKMAKKLSDVCDYPIVLEGLVQPSLSGLGYDVPLSAIDSAIVLPARENEWTPFLDQLSFALRWGKENSKKPAEAAV